MRERCLQPIFTMRKISILFILILLSIFVLGQTPAAAKLTDSLFKAGTFKAAVTTYDFPDEIKILQNTALTSLKNNPQWADKYLVIRVERGDKDLTYMDELGLTRAEFIKMINGFNKGQVPKYSDTLEVSVEKSNGIITFHCPQNLSLFNFLRIDTKTNTIYLDNVKVTRELRIDGKFYARILKGIECGMCEEIKSIKKRSSTAFAGLSVGINKYDLRSTLCLMYGKPNSGQEFFQPRYLIMTFL